MQMVCLQHDILLHTSSHCMNISKSKISPDLGGEDALKRISVAGEATH